MRLENLGNMVKIFNKKKKNVKDAPRKIENVMIDELYSMITAMQILAMTPLRKSKNGGLEFRLFSLQMLYFLSISIFGLLIAAWYSYRALNSTVMQEGRRSLVLFVYLGNMCLPYILPFLSLAQVHEQARYFSTWLNFQRAVEGQQGKRLELGLRNTARGAAIITYIALITVLFRPITQKKLPTIDDCLHAFTGAHQSLHVFSWYFICKALQIASTRLFHDFEENLRGRLVLDSKRDQVLLDMRKTWLMHLRLVVLAGQSISMASVFLICLSFGSLLGFSYQTAVSFGNNTAVPLLVSFVVFSAGNIIIICSSAHKLNTQIHRDLFAAMRIIKNGNISENTRTLMLTFLTQMIKICPRISFNGYIIVGRSLISTLFAALVTNLAVLLQLNVVQEGFNSGDELFNFGEKLVE